MTVPSIMVERFKLHFLGTCLFSYFLFLPPTTIRESESPSDRGAKCDYKTKY